MLQVKNLRKVYRPKRGEPVRALDGVSLKFPETGLVFVLGKSGSGKSTLLHVMGGLDTADEGEIIIGGKSSRDFTQRDFDAYRNTYLGFIFQEYNVLDEFTVAGNIGLALELQGERATEERVAAILREVDLEGLAGRKPSELSGGQKQRVAIARALIKNPQIIMADEPTGALDSNTGKQVFDTLKRLSYSHLVIVVSHDREFAEQFGDRVIELKDGQVISDITKERTAGDEGAPDVCVIGERFIRIRRGKLLTAEDVEMINRCLAMKKTDTVIPIEPGAEAETKKILRFEEHSGEAGVFVTTDESRLREEKQDSFRFIRSRLPVKNAFRMGVSGLKHKKVRLIISILLAVIAFSLFGIADTAASYDKVRASFDSIKANDINYLSISKSRRKDQGGWYQYLSEGLTEADRAAFSERYGVEFRFVQTNGSNSSINLQNIYPRGGNTIFSGYLRGAMGLDDALLTETGMTMDAGALPKSGEIVLTKQTALAYERGHYLDENGDSKAIRDYREIVGKTVALSSGEQVRIAGIVDSKLPEKFDVLRERGSADVQNDPAMMQLYLQYQLQVGSSYHEMLFTYPGEEGRCLSQSNVNWDTIDVGTETRRYPAYWLGAPRGNSYFIDPNKTSLERDEVLLSIEQLLIFQWDFDRDWLQRIQTYRQEHEAELSTLFPYEIDYTMSMRNFNDPESWFLHPQSGPSGLELLLEIMPAWIEETFPDGLAMTGSYRVENREEQRLQLSGLKIVGLEVPASYPYGNGITVAKEVYRQLVYGSSEPTYAQMMAPNRVDDRTLKELLSASLNVENDVPYYRLQNGVTSMVESFDSSLVMVARVFLYVGLGFAVFAALLLMNFISTSVAFKRREIGILRAVGARSADVFSIFFWESFVIACINFTLACLVTGIVVPVINTLMNTGIGLELLHFGVRQVGLLFGVSLLVAALGTFLPVYRVAKKKPIEAIRDK